MISSEHGNVKFNGKVAELMMDAELILRNFREILEEEEGSDEAKKDIERIYKNSLLSMEERVKNLDNSLPKLLKELEDLIRGI